jgi:hypothetical protein
MEGLTMAAKQKNGNQPSLITGATQGGAPMPSLKVEKKKKTSRGK